jgi:pyruvate/2-oxoglutarate dehydrogenase complex dihydrolipoamide acyltransferase (E2) component
MPNLEIDEERELSTFRKIALGTWSTTHDPSVYGALTLEMDQALAYIDAFRAATGRRVTVTHMMARAAAAVLEQVPDANALLRLGKIYRRKGVGVFFQVAMEDPKTGKIDLSGATIHEPQTKTLVEICDELEKRFEKVRKGKDTALAKSRNLFKRIPIPLIRPLLDLTSFASYTLNLDLSWAGIPQDAFGSIMITNIGALGLEEAFVPLVPYSRVPLLIALGAIRDTVVARNGVPTVAKTMKLCATFDHRVLDGAHAAAMAKTVKAWIERPFEHFDRLPSR